MVDPTYPPGTYSPWLRLKGVRGRLPLSAARMMAALQAIYLRAAELPKHFMMHSFRVGGWLPQHISDRGGGGRDHEDWWLEDGVDSIA